MSSGHTSQRSPLTSASTCTAAAPKKPNSPAPARIGHELRTPLTAIGSCTELLRDDPTLNPGTHDMRKVIDRNTTRLRWMIDELLDMAALDAGEGVHPDEVVDLAPIAAAAVAAVGETASITLRTELAAGGLLTVTLTATDHTDVTLTVADTGIGIPPEDRGHIFTRFYRTTLTRDRQIPGAGLGLAISRAIIQAHAGTLTLAPGTPATTQLIVRLPTAGTTANRDAADPTEQLD